jgi:alcohol dehydrogenase
MCGTDLQLLRGSAPFTGIPGHEFVGTVIDAPRADSRWIGRRVVGEINIGCGRCEWCRNRIKEHCPNRTVVGIRGRPGAFAERLALPAANLHEVPAEVDDEAAVFAEPVAAACRILEQVEVSADRTVAVIGDGRLGLLIAQVLMTTGATVVVHGRHEWKLRIARALGLEAYADAAAPAARHDIVVEATGRGEGLNRALELVKPRGTIVLKTTCDGDSSWTGWKAVVDEVRLIGSRCGPFAPALALLQSGAVKTKPLVTGWFSLADHQAAFDAARSGLKVLLDPHLE